MLSTLMKISLGLILFTMISTVLVYAQTTDNTVIKIIENGYLEENSSHILIIHYFHLLLDLNNYCSQ